MKKNALTMDQLEKVSGGILNVMTDDYTGESPTVSWRCKDCGCFWGQNIIYQPPSYCPSCTSINIEESDDY